MARVPRRFRADRMVWKREQLGWSRKDLAEKAGLGRDTIGKLERGERTPRLDTAEKIAAPLGVSVEWLMA